MKEDEKVSTIKWKDVKVMMNFTEEEIRQEMEIIQKIIDARKDENITQAELSKRSGVSQPVIARMEKGVNSPQLNTLIKILNALGRKLKI